MFSVDNFYSYLQSCYGREIHHNITLYKHSQNGSKDIRELRPYGEVPDDETGKYFFQKGAMILHDQEPFLKDYLNTYRLERYQANNFDSTWMEMSDKELFHQKFRSWNWPIFCHSEKNSDDIKWLENIGVITCHYLWHGLIARDWFRHWKHHPTIKKFQMSWNKRFLLYARGKDGTRSYRVRLLESLKDIKDSIHYDWQQQLSIPSHYSAHIDVDDVAEGAIQIVAETIFDQNKIHATEKVFKPMVMKQPFLVFAGPGTLEYLRSYGFKTFSHLWDESYDLESNHDKRFAMLIDQIKKLNQLSEQDFKKIMEDCQDVIEHNHQHFYSELFETIMLNELHQNIDLAIKHQQDLSKLDPGGSFFNVVDSMNTRGIKPFRGMENLLDWLVQDYYNDQTVLAIRGQYPWFDQRCRSSHRERHSSSTG